MSRLFPNEPSRERVERRPGLLLAVAAVHGLAGAAGLTWAIRVDFAGWWLPAAPLAWLLLVHAHGLAFARRRFDLKLSRFLVGLFRIGGGFTLIVGAMAMREHMDGAYTVMGIALGFGVWGVAFGHVLDGAEPAFARSP